MAAVAPLRLLALAAALTGVFVLTMPATAMAAKPCWKQIIDDWYKNERIDGSYSQKCYDEAEKNLPQDLRDYSDLPAEIARAAARPARPAGRSGQVHPRRAERRPGRDLQRRQRRQ